MAKVTFGPIVSDARNKQGDVVFSRSRGCNITRAWVDPDQTETPDRLTAYLYMREANAAWIDTLTEAERQAWRLFADGSSPKSRSSIPGPLSGQNWFIRSFLNGRWWTGATPSAPPPHLQIQTVGQPTLSADPANSSLELAFSPDPVPSGTYYAVYATPPLSGGIFNPRHQWKPLLPLPPTTTSPYNLWPTYSAIWPAVAIGQKIFVKLAALRAVNNLLGPPMVCYAIAISSTAGATDNFDRPDSHDLGPNWTLCTADQFQIYSHQVTGGTASALQMAYWNATSFATNHYAQLRITKLDDTTPAIGPAVRVASGALTGYAALFWATAIYLYKYISGAQTVLGSYGAASVGDVVRLEVSADQLTVKRNGSTIIGPVTDSDIPTGNPGMHAYTDGTSVLADDWEGGNV
jgi:hypothetical protein